MKERFETKIRGEPITFEQKAEEYEPVKIPFGLIKRMIKNGTWKGFLEEEELLYNLEHNLYSECYAELAKEILEKQDQESDIKEE